MSDKNREHVVVLHGLAETPSTMAQLELALRQGGYSVSNIAYPSTLAPIEHLVRDHILPLFCQFATATRLHFVTHSLGGVLLHAALGQHRPANLGRVVMSAPGLQGSDALEIYRRSWLFRMMFGPAAFQSGTGSDGFARQLDQVADYALGVIAGCVSFDPVANLVVPWPHDGKISVAHTKLRGMADHIVLPTSHDLIASDPAAIYQTLRFLKHGSFFHLLSQPQGLAGEACLAA